MNTYEVEAGTVFVAGKTVCPCPLGQVTIKALYKFMLPLPLSACCMQSAHVAVMWVNCGQMAGEIVMPLGTGLVWLLLHCVRCSHSHY